VPNDRSRCQYPCRAVQEWAKSKDVTSLYSLAASQSHHGPNGRFLILRLVVPWAPFESWRAGGIKARAKSHHSPATRFHNNGYHAGDPPSPSATTMMRMEKCPAWSQEFAYTVISSDTVNKKNRTTDRHALHYPRPYVSHRRSWKPPCSFLIWTTRRLDHYAAGPLDPTFHCFRSARYQVHPS
jgi:hypothetical protein